MKHTDIYTVLQMQTYSSLKLVNKKENENNLF